MELRECVRSRLQFILGKRWQWVRGKGETVKRQYSSPGKPERLSAEVRAGMRECVCHHGTELENFKNKHVTNWLEDEIEEAVLNRPAERPVSWNYGRGITGFRVKLKTSPGHSGTSIAAWMSSMALCSF